MLLERDLFSLRVYGDESRLEVPAMSDAPESRVYRIEAVGLDPITIYVEQFRPGAGRMTVQCYARAWTSFWGSHGAEAPLETFVASCDAEYIAGGLTWGLNSLILKRHEKTDSAYLVRIVRAIQEHFRRILRESP
jgi:hypothetical protein